ncbi:MAG TPA: TIGR02300 family protein [Stellaceae bacterium]|nr:TIGR02300 family protein [Stellaceae bacterium]HYC13557.1 TIGR02300 family protein [Stellaceae bacterium]
MAKPEWGTKRICPNCGARYYDMHHDPIICPKCKTEYDPETLLKTRRKAPVQPEPEVAPVAPPPPEPEAEEPEPAEAETPAEGGSSEEEEEEEVLEDASELGEDEDDMAEVIENVDEEER